MLRFANPLARAILTSSYNRTLPSFRHFSKKIDGKAIGLAVREEVAQEVLSLL